MADEMLYECMDCGNRTTDVSHGRLCTCGGYLRNLSVPRME